MVKVRTVQIVYVVSSGSVTLTMEYNISWTSTYVNRDVDTLNPFC